MSQHDMTLDNASGLGFRTDANNALQALASISSGASAPSPSFPCQLWADTGTSRLKRRNAANSAWLDQGPLDAALRDAASQGEFVADTGAANAYVCNFVPAITARSESTPIRFKATNANTGACTINDGLGTVALVGANNAALRGGEIFANGIAWAQWNTSVGGGSYVLLFCTGSAAPVVVVGSTRNAKMSITAASATATLTADEVVVKAALGAQAWLLPSFSKTVNLATTGAGGMDTGTATASSWIGLYAIYNPATQTSALLAVNAANTVLPAIYGGANMPAGYTASALLSVLRTTAASLFDIAFQTDNYITHVDRVAVNSGTIVGSLTNIAIAGNVPGNAKTVSSKGNIASSSGPVLMSYSVAGSTSGIGSTGYSANNAVAGGGSSSSLLDIPVITSQNISYTATVGSGAMSFILSTRGYTI